MNYLITGATGFIGRTLVTQLLHQGHSVNYLASKRSAVLDGRAAFHSWARGETLSLNSVPRLDAVVNLAGEPLAQRWTDTVKKKIYDSRVAGTRQLVSAIGELRHRPTVLISASGVGYYGDRGDEVLTEQSASGNDFLAGVCIHWEREALRARDFGLRVVLLRIATVLGRGGGALEKMAAPFRFGLGGTFGNGSQWTPWVHLQDLVRLIIFAAEHPALDGPLNACSPEPMTNRQFSTTLAQTLHRPSLFPAPKFALKMMLGEMSELVFASERVIPEATMASGFSFEHGQLNKALGESLK